MYKCFLDDLRMPTNIFPTTKNREWTIVRNYDEFVRAIKKHGLPFFISFDHDLADEHYRASMFNADKHYTKYYNDGTFKEKTGYHAAKWLVDYCMDNNRALPQWNVHSANPCGAENIRSYLQSYERSRL